MGAATPFADAGSADLDTADGDVMPPHVCAACGHRSPGDAAANARGHDAALAAQRRDSALLSLLNGAGDASLPATILGLRPDQRHAVIAAGAAPADLEALRLALRAEFPDERSVLSDATLFAIVPVAGEDQPAALVARLRGRLARATRPKHDLPIGVGTVVPGVYSLQESAAVARTVLRALRIRVGAQPLVGDAPAARVAAAEDVADAYALIEAADALRPQGERLAAPLLALARYDAEHRTELLPSVLLALEHLGNLAEAARRLGIHANSLRARLERAQELSGVNLAEPASALRTMVAFLAYPPVHHLATRQAGLAEPAEPRG